MSHRHWFKSPNMTVCPSCARSATTFPGMMAAIAGASGREGRMPRLRTIAVLAALVSVAGPATAQDWPARPVTMVVPFAAGGPADTVGRILAPRLSELLRQQVVIENVGGAGGMTGSDRVAKAAPAGYQL